MAKPMEYWMPRDLRQQKDRVRQRFYVACCLLMSSVQDYFLGLKEKEDKNFNWSATCSYYSMVHTARLICFLAHGDFAKGHKDMADFLRQPEGCGARLSRNWLHGFSGGTVKSGKLEREDHDVLLTFFEGLGIRDVRGKLKSFAELFDSGRDLRNSSNYEALLIAHEYRHHDGSPFEARYPHEHHCPPVDLTIEFGKLADCMSEAAKKGMTLGIEAFVAFMDCDPSLDRERDALRGFFWDFVVTRVKEAMVHKLRGESSCIAELEKVVDRLRTSRGIGSDFGHVERSINQKVFDRKHGLMSEFKRKVDRLEETLHPGQ